MSDATIKEKMKKVGDSFRQRRKELNLSLKEAENATSIRLNYLQSIEEGEMGKLISPMYAQGFVRQYASFLGVDGDRVIRENPEIFNRPEAHEFAYGIGTLEQRGNPGAGVKWLPNALWAAAFVLFLILAWVLARFFEII
jgi:cytoskeletal protein RodZ